MNQPNAQSNPAKPAIPPRRATFVWAAAAVTACATLGLLGSRLLGVGMLRQELTFTASTGYLMVALFGGALRFGYGRLVLGGLAFCWIGDMVGPRNFMLGAYAFLVAHLLFIPAFLTRNPSWRAAVITGIPLAIASAASMIVLLPHVPVPERPPIIAYTVVITLMTVTAFGAGSQHRIIPVAALLFYISDHFVARWKYFGGDWNGLFCYPLYYTACLLFACSVFLVRCAEEESPGAGRSDR